MMRRNRRRGRAIPALFAFFCAGLAVGWLIHERIDTKSAITPSQDAPRISAPAPPNGADLPVRPSPQGTSGRRTGDPIEELRDRNLRLPVDDARIEMMKGQFDQRRAGGARGHEAVDILAPRGTPIRAVDDGRIANLFTSKAGGTTIYQFDRDERFCYYYAHLERYAADLHDGQTIRRGDVIGYVGTSGNAPPNTPHLHFAIFELTADRRWWQGKAIDPYVVFQSGD